VRFNRLPILILAQEGFPFAPPMSYSAGAAAMSSLKAS
jgi:hypothetical protein